MKAAAEKKKISSCEHFFALATSSSLSSLCKEKVLWSESARDNSSDHLFFIVVVKPPLESIVVCDGLLLSI